MGSVLLTAFLFKVVESSKRSNGLDINKLGTERSVVGTPPLCFYLYLSILIVILEGNLII